MARGERDARRRRSRIAYSRPTRRPRERRRDFRGTIGSPGWGTADDLIIGSCTRAGGRVTGIVPWRSGAAVFLRSKVFGPAHARLALECTLGPSRNGRPTRALELACQALAAARRLLD